MTKRGKNRMSAEADKRLTQTAFLVNFNLMDGE